MGGFIGYLLVYLYPTIYINWQQSTTGSGSNSDHVNLKVYPAINSQLLRQIDVAAQSIFYFTVPLVLPVSVQLDQTYVQYD